LDVEVTATKVSKNSKGNDCIGLRLRIITGPYAGLEAWDNLHITPTSATALRIFFETCATLGVQQALFDMGASTEQVAAAMVGARVRVKNTHEAGKRRDGTPDTFNNFGFYESSVAVPVAPVPVPPVPPVAVVPPAVPVVPVAPLPVVPVVVPAVPPAVVPAAPAAVVPGTNPF
jgi:hypothetical protein